MPVLFQTFRLKSRLRCPFVGHIVSVVVNIKILRSTDDVKKKHIFLFRKINDTNLKATQLVFQIYHELAMNAVENAAKSTIG